MNDNQPTVTPARPNPDLQSLNRLVGTWQLSGDTSGTITYEWMAGGFFLIQHFDFVLFGHPVKGMEVIGHVQPFGEAPSPEIRSRVYSSLGETLDYVYEADGDTLTSGVARKDRPPTSKASSAPTATPMLVSGCGPAVGINPP